MRARPHPALWWAALLQRVSGVLLAFFLPAHFYVLALAVRDDGAMDGFLRWTDAPLVKAAEIGLVFLLAAHFFGGLRVLALELLPWRPGQKTLAAAAGGGAFAVAGLFLLSAW